MRDINESWNSLKNRDEVINAINKMEEPIMVGAFTSVPYNVWEFTFLSSNGEAITIKDTDPTIIIPVLYNKTGEEKKIELEEVKVSTEKLLEKIEGEVLRLCPGQKMSRVFILLHNKGEQEFLATVTTDKLNVVTINIDHKTGRVKNSKKVEIFSILSKNK